jgi:formylglycine-generating enzyme required for sulfatase activity
MVSPSPRVTIPAGSFLMGATADDLQVARRLCADELRGGGALLLELSPRCGSRFDGESPQAEVFVPAFALDRTEVTVAAYAACVRADRCRPTPELREGAGERAQQSQQNSDSGEDARLPVERVTWWEATAFCRWRGGRLPSEAEWEKAARAFGRRLWPWGSAFQERRANHGRSERLGPGGTAGTDEDSLDDADGFAGRAPVGSFPPGASPYGVLDLAGNVWEWTAGYFSREPPQSATRFDPRGPMSGDERTIRGGSYRSPPSDLRLTRRVGLPPGERLAGVGFRCAYDLPP